MCISPSVLFPNVLHPLRVCTVVHRLSADSPALLTLARFTARYPLHGL